MSERKVLNKYYPPDFDPSKIPKLKLPKDRQYVVRLMAPFNMRCKTCGEYIYKGKKFNARKETVQNEVYLGLPIFRFYIKCTRCLAEITFKTDPENTDYAIEHGASRNFQAEKLIEEEEKRLQKEREEEELNNPMKVLENRTKDSKLEMEVLENLQELKDLNQRQANVDFEAMLTLHKEYEQELKRRQEEDDLREIKAMLDQANQNRRIVDSESDEEEIESPPRVSFKMKPTDILNEGSEPPIKRSKEESWEKSVGKLSTKSQLAGLVVVRKCPDKQHSGSHSQDTGTVNGQNCPSSGTSSQNTEVSKSNTLVSEAQPLLVSPSSGPSSLSQLGAYSDTESSCSD